MLINPALYVLLIVSIILLSIVLISLLISYAASIKRLNKLEKDQDKLYQETKIKQQEAIFAAQNTANQIIDESTDIGHYTKSTLDDAISSIKHHEEEILARESDVFVKAYEKEAEELKNDSIKRFQSVSDDILKYIDKHFQLLTESLTSQTTRSQEEAATKIKTQYQALEKELSEYKKRQIEKIDTNISQILLNISKMAFGSSLPIEKHEEIAIEALEEAKKQGGLT